MQLGLHRSLPLSRNDKIKNDGWGNTHPSKLSYFGREEVGLCAFLSLRERLDFKVYRTQTLTRLRLPSPSLDMVVRWCFYNDLLSLCTHHTTNINAIH